MFRGSLRGEAMKERQKENDVSNLVDVTSPEAVKNEVLSLYEQLYPEFSASVEAGAVARAFDDFERLFTGHYPGYTYCDTPYHDIQHTLDMSLALARLIYGHDHGAKASDQLGFHRASVGVICALFHDAGYIRHNNDSQHRNGAEYTKTHVSRSAGFLGDYLPSVGLGSGAFISRKIVHFTGYEVSVDRLQLEDKKFQLVGYMLGSADLMAQMADRCYLEKCRDRLYPEFVLGGIDRIERADGSSHRIYTSPTNLLQQTPDFYQKSVFPRLEHIFEGVYRYAGDFFSKGNLYMREIDNNVDYLQKVLRTGDFSLLRREPLPNLATTKAAQTFNEVLEEKLAQ